MKTEPLLNSDGTLHQFILKIDGKRYFCECKCNVFHKPDKNNLDLYQCNGCSHRFICT
jgi:hypothetical protein